MTGFGIREQWQLTKKFTRSQENLWRPESVMHQMSLNGSLVLSKNHDFLWSEILADMLNETGRGWSSLQWRLRAMPGHQARKALWRTSYLWQRESCKQLITMTSISWQGAVAVEETMIDNFESSLLTVSNQLSSLAWCEKDTDREPIKVIDIQKASEKLRPEKKLKL